MDQSLLNEIVEYVEHGSTYGSAVLTLRHRSSGVSFEYFGIAVVDGSALIITSNVLEPVKRLTGVSVTIDLEIARAISIVRERACTFDLGEFEGTLTFDGESHA